MTRFLRQEERELIALLLQSRRTESGFLNQLETCQVEEMEDGKMGSLRFVSPQDCRYGSTLAEAEFDDEDGVRVSAALYLNNFGDLFELDVWRVDFMPLRNIPAPDKIRLMPR